jgi:hypothetical protein
MRCLLVAVLLAAACAAQTVHTAKPSDIQGVQGFLKVCDREPGSMSLENAELMKHPTGDVTELLYRAMDASISDYLLCTGYVTGIYEGWKEGHEHGVVAAHFPDGIPADESAALKKLPLAEIQSASRAMNVDVPCLPDQVSFGDLQRVVLKHIREEVKKNPFMGLASTSRAVPLALSAEYPCSTVKSESIATPTSH